MSEPWQWSTRRLREGLRLDNAPLAAYCSFRPVISYDRPPQVLKRQEDHTVNHAAYRKIAYQQIGDPYVGPAAASGRMALLKQFRAKAEMVRPVRKPISHGEAKWIRNMMQPLGNEGNIHRNWRVVRDAWIRAGCPKDLAPWRVVEGRGR